MTERDPDVVRFAIRLTPRGGADRVDGVADGALRVRVAAAPVDGAANDALIRLLASELHVPRDAIRVVTGFTGRRKLVEIATPGVRATVDERWPGLST